MSTVSRGPTVPLKYPAGWKFKAFPHQISQEANSEFIDLVCTIAEGTDAEWGVYEDFKTAYGVESGSSSSSWARHDLMGAMSESRSNAARYIGSFFSGIEAVKERRIEVPDVDDLNAILVKHNIPLVIDPPDLKLREGDISFVQDAELDDANTLGFILNEEIGRGGFGVVHRVTRQTKLGEYNYAMKVFKPSAFQPRERARQRFIRELHALEKLQHRGIIPLLEAGLTAEGDPYILMPYIRGKNVKEALAGEYGYEVQKAFDEILRAMMFAHKHEILHRDLKPENILIREADKQPIILDFGAAYLLDEQDEKLTTTFIGTGAYAPPEFHYSPENKSVKHDVFAVGIVIYEVITGQRPNPSKYDPIGDVRGFSGVDAIIQKAISSEGERYKTMGDLWLDWCEFGRNLEIPF